MDQKKCLWTKPNIFIPSGHNAPFFQQNDFYAFQDILYQELFVIKTNRIFKSNYGPFIMR